MQRRLGCGLQVGVRGQKLLLPAPSCDGGWTSRRLTAGEFADWIKAYLMQYGGCKAEQVSELGGHSCKHMFLAWAYKG